MGEFFIKLLQSFGVTFVAATAKVFAERLFSEKGKEKSTLASEQRNQGGKSK